MIATLSGKPVLRIGNYCVTSYDDEWLAEALDQAARRMGGDIAPFRDDLLAGVDYYLEQVCSLKVLPVEELFARLKKMLRQVGLDSLADHLALSAPPISVNLLDLADSCPLPLFFYQRLREELNELRHSGVSHCAFSGVRECALLLEGARRWTPKCERTEEEILHVISRSWTTVSPLVA